MADILYFNGRFTTTDERVLGVEDRGFQFGDAIYEVFKFAGRRPVFLLDHYRRLERNLRELEIRSPWDEVYFGTVMAELIERSALEDGIVYIQISRGEAPRSHFWPEGVEPTVVVYSRRFVFPDAAKKGRGIRVITADDLRWQRCDLKSVNLLANAMGKKRAQREGADEVLFLHGGLVREGASSSFFGVREGRIITHPLDPFILPGVVRDRTIGLALESKVRVEERPVREHELYQLEEAFITSTTQGVMPVVQIDGRTVGNGGRGPVTAELQQLFDEDEAR
jgi:D-alanine transaminase